MLEQILPGEVAVVETFRDIPDATLFAEEEAVIARAVTKRRTEFTTARACARAALARLGEPAAPILRGLRGAPQWPRGVVGSITHCEGFRAAAVARQADVAAMGLDAEPDQPLPDGVLDMIALAGERTRIASLPAAGPGTPCWDRLLFCAKESVYKTWFPATERWLDFDQADIVIDPVAGTFTADLLVPGLLLAGSPVTSLRGRWLADRGLVATAITVPGQRKRRPFGP